MIDAGTLEVADELKATELTDDAVVDLIKEGVALDDDAVIEGGVTVDPPVGDCGLDIFMDPAEGVDICGVAKEVGLGIDVDVAEDVVGGSTGVDVLDVKGIAAAAGFIYGPR